MQQLITGLLLVRSDRPRPTALLPARSYGKTRGCCCSR